MLLLFLSLYFSRAHTAPVASLFESPIVFEDDITGVAATRTLWNIVYTCLTTTFAITWISMHPNLPRDNKSYTPLLLRLLLATYALLIPEAIVFWAAFQWKAAHYYADHFKKEYKWTPTHGFFLIMGGFTIPYKVSTTTSKRRYRVLPAHEFKDLADQKKIIFPDIDEEDIMDKSKGDPLAKGFVILQTLWFVIQILARFAQKLEVTELEVITFALVPLNVVTYYFWMHKPLSVKRPVRVEWASRSYMFEAAGIQAPPAPFSPQLDSGYPVSPGSPTPNPITEEPQSDTGENHSDISSIKSQKGLLNRFLRWMKFWAREADEMMELNTGSHIPTSNPQQLSSPADTPPAEHTQHDEKPKKKRWFSLQSIVTVAETAAGGFTDRLNAVPGSGGRPIPIRGATTDSYYFPPSSTVSLWTNSIIGGLVAIILIVFLAVFAILSISPLLFVALGFLCVAILTAPWVATRAFRAIGHEPDTLYGEKKDNETPATNEKIDRRLPIFYAPSMNKRSSDIMLTVTIIGATVFGGLHVLAWNFDFPSPTEHLLWRISSIALTSLPGFYLGLHFLTPHVVPNKDHPNTVTWGRNLAKKLIRGLILVGIPAYTLARLYVLAEAVISLRDPRPGTLIAVTWSKFIPHF